MGCGASDLHTQDGSIAQGKGEAKPVLTDLTVTTVHIWGEGAPGDKLTLQYRDVPSDPKLLKDAKFYDKAAANPLEPVVVEGKLGLKNSRWVLTTPEGPVALPYPGFTPLKLPQVVSAAAKKDEKKHKDTVVKAGTKKDKNHPYATDADKAVKDLEACEKLVSPAQMDDDLNIYKDSLGIVEDTLTASQANTNGSVNVERGFVAEKDGDVQLSLPERGLKMKDDKENTDLGMRGNFVKANNKKNDVVLFGYGGFVKAGAKAVGLEDKDLCPASEGLLQFGLGLKPYSEPYDTCAVFGEKGLTLPTVEEFAAAKEKRVKDLLAADKAAGASIKEKEGSAEFVEEHKARVKKAMEYALKATKGLDEDSISQGTRVLARWQAKGELFSFQEGVVESSVAEGAWYEDADAKPEPIKKEGKYVYVKFDDESFAYVPITAVAAEKIVPAAEEDLLPGTLVRARFAGAAFQDGVIAGLKNDNGYPVKFDAVWTHDVKPEDIRPAHDVDKIASFPHILYRQLNDVTFSWIDSRTDLTVAVNVWRDGDDDSKETHQLKAFENPLKDAEGKETGNTVHGGYKVPVTLLQERSYRYNFTVTPNGGSAEYFVDFGKDVQETGSKVFSYTVTP